MPDDVFMGKIFIVEVDMSWERMYEKWKEDGLYGTHLCAPSRKSRSELLHAMLRGEMHAGIHLDVCKFSWK